MAAICSANDRGQALADGAKYDTRWNLLAERFLDGQTAGTYIHGTRMDEILQWAVVEETKLLPLADGRSSTVALTDRQGRVVERYRYTAYGIPEVNGLLSKAYSYRLLFNGREWLPRVGLNEHRNRYYHISTARWTSADPLRFQKEKHLYAAFGNNPISYVDADGLAASWAVGLYTRNISIGSSLPDWMAPDHQNVRVVSYTGCNCSGGEEFAMVRGFFADDFLAALGAAAGELAGFGDGWVPGHVGPDTDVGSCSLQCVSNARFQEVLSRMQTGLPTLYHAIYYNCQAWAAQVLQ